MSDSRPPQAASDWLRYQERGSVFAYRLIRFIALALGRRVTRWLLYPICLYYMTFNRATVRASRLYLSRLRGRPARWTEIFRHHVTFAAVLLDRAYFYAGRLDLFDLRLHGADRFLELMARGQGCLMLSAHMGSFELVRTTGMQRNLVVNMLMYEENARMLATVSDQCLTPDARRRIIPIGRIDSLIVAKERLEAGEVVGILADRVVGDEGTVTVPFLDVPAKLPSGPFRAASVLNAPVVLFVCLYRGGNRYDLHLETLADQLSLDRRESKDVEQWARRYAQRLEHYCRMAPENWFNFYDFWAAASATGADQPLGERHAA